MNWFLGLRLASQILVAYFIIVNAVTFFLSGIDKLKSRTRDRRIPERRLLFGALIGGLPGLLFGMWLFRHKTKKLSFQAMLAVIVLIQILLVNFVFRKK